MRPDNSARACPPWLMIRSSCSSELAADSDPVVVCIPLHLLTQCTTFLLLSGTVVLGISLPVVAERETVEQYLLRWVEMTQPQVKPSTWKRYRNHVRYQIIPALGKTVPSRLTAQQVQMFYAHQSEASASTSMQQVHVILHRALQDAARMGLVQRNVMEMVRAPRREPREMTILSEDQAKIFPEASVGDRLETLYILALTTGMRQGELIGLRWQDIDFEQHKLQVRVSYQASGKPEQPYRSEEHTS